MDPLRLLDDARERGLSVGLDGDKLVVRGSPSLEPLALTLLDHKLEVVLLLRCAHCGATDGLLLPTYWSAWSLVLCPTCVASQVERFERNGWPQVPWEWGDCP